MKISSKGFAPLDFTQLLVGFAGILYLLTGLALLMAPAWFFATIGPFAPFNRHYMGDLGAFLLPLGVGLLLAARDPSKHKLLVRIAVGGSGLHALNHTYDAVLDRAPLGHKTIVLRAPCCCATTTPCSTGHRWVTGSSIHCRC